jgi:hypothetical protein
MFLPPYWKMTKCGNEVGTNLPLFRPLIYPAHKKDVYAGQPRFLVKLPGL